MIHFLGGLEMSVPRLRGQACRAITQHRWWWLDDKLCGQPAVQWMLIAYTNADSVRLAPFCQYHADEVRRNFDEP